ncbi:hypothetical protein PIB30_083737 [Stylosanthes scabra]|uniref:Ubiquitin-like protease family profile domain-containing protein n=1 Tax=Stylosanthes scabra TaxID=79078 RepID=A0ABU6XRQ4_9FABA|nr:hypothetical protein [Stylosanthes scabra]
MSPNLGLDKENFDREKAATRQWWLIPICHRRHWYLYAFNLVKRELLVLDSLFDHPFDDKRKIVDLYVMILKIVFPTYHHTEIGFQCSYAKVPKQPNNDDCGICMLKFMESWTEDSNLKEFNNEHLNEIRRRLVIEIATSIYNTHRIAVFQKSFDLPQRRNNPNLEKKKEVKMPFTAPSTKEITKKAGGKKAAEKRKKK